MTFCGRLSPNSSGLDVEADEIFVSDGSKWTVEIFSISSGWDRRSLSRIQCILFMWIPM